MKVIKTVILFAMSIVCSITSASEWEYSKSIDEFDDASAHTAIVNSVNGEGFAVARCVGNSRYEFKLYFSTGDFIGSRKEAIA